MDTKSIRYNKNQGFTLIELLITMAITSIVMGAVGVIHSSQQKSYRIQEEVAAMQQNIRAAMYIMEREIRLAGYDPTTSGNFGITDICYRDKDYVLNLNGYSTIEFTADDNLNGSTEATETISFSLYDPEGDGKLELARRISGVRSAIAENIYALGFAFAFDADGDGALDTYEIDDPPPPAPPLQPNEKKRIIWAIDSGNNNWLDLNLDGINKEGVIDGVIDEKDDKNDNGIIDGQALADGKVNISAIRAVRIWLLARSDEIDNKIINKGPYVVGDKVIKPLGDDRNYRYELLSTVVKCRNMGN
jgi:type IV pilus assembly protein PilW